MAESTPSAVPGGLAGPAVEFAEWLPALGGSRLLRVHGEASPGTPPTLVLRTATGEHRIQPRAQSRFTRAHEWRASFLIPAEIVASGWSETALEWPGGTHLPLPDPPIEPRAEIIDPSVLATLRARRFSRPEEATRAAAEPAAPSPAAGEPAAPSPAAEPRRGRSASSPEVVTPSPGGAMSPSPSAAGGPRSWTDLPDGFSGSVFEAEAVWTAKRAELERELSRAAEAIARAREGERAAREAVLAALANARADLRATRAARAADEGTLTALAAELDAERIAHAVTRRTASDFRMALARERREAEGLRTALEAERSARADAEESLHETRAEGSALMERIAELDRHADRNAAAHERRAREHARTAAAVARRPEQETGELLANLDAAAAALRATHTEPTTAQPAEAEPPADAAPTSESASSPPADLAAPIESASSPPADLAAPIESASSLPTDGGGAESTSSMPADIAAPNDSASSMPADIDAAPETASSTPADIAAPAESATSAPANVAVPGEGAASTDLVVADARPLRRVLVELAKQDPVAAGEIVLGLLPAQGPLFDGPVAYDLTVHGVGTFAVTVAEGAAAVERISKPRSRGEALFELRSDPLTLAELLAGDERRIGRFGGRARVSRRRRRARALRVLPAARMSLAEAVRAGARLEPALVYRALPLAIDPQWTAGYAFTVAQEIVDPDSRTWYLTVRDGAGLEITESERAADATVTMTRAAFDRLLKDEPPAPGERPLVRGDRAAVALLKAWTDRARGAA